MGLSLVSQALPPGLCCSDGNLCSIPVQILVQPIGVVSLNSVPGAAWYHHIPGISRMNLEVPNIWVFGGSKGTKNQTNIVNYHCRELLGGEDPEERCSGYLRSWQL